MASAIFFLDLTGKVLLSRDFRGDVPLSSVRDFSPCLADHPEPFFSHNGVHYMYIKHADIYILAVSRSNTNVASIMVFLNRLVQALEHFVHTVEYESIRDNFVVIYELLDEMMDYGHVQTTDINLLSDYVTQSSYKLEVSQAVVALTDKVSWRTPGIFYRKNELFVDVIETVSATLDPLGNVVSAGIVGRIALRAYLSGMPLLKLGINDRAKSATANTNVSKYRANRYVDLQDMAFHQCVDLERFEQDRTIEFIPPDGPFDLLTYRVVPDPSRKPLFALTSSLTIKGRSRVLVSCTIKAQYKKRQSCAFAEFAIPVPADCDSPRCKTSVGQVVYAPERQAVVWRVTGVSGGTEASMQAELLLPATGDLPVKPTAPVQVRFEVPGLAASGLEIRYLKIVEDLLKYQSFPWVRYITKNGDYEVRTLQGPSGPTSHPSSRAPSNAPSGPSSRPSRQNTPQKSSENAST